MKGWPLSCACTWRANIHNAHFFTEYIRIVCIVKVFVALSLQHCPYIGFLCLMDSLVKLPVHHQPALLFFAVIVYLVDSEDSLWENNKLLDQLQRWKSAKYPKCLLKTKIWKKLFTFSSYWGDQKGNAIKYTAFSLVVVNQLLLICKNVWEVFNLTLHVSWGHLQY